MNIHLIGGDSESDGVAPDRDAVLRRITSEQLLHLGMRQVVYLRYGVQHGRQVFLPHGADGSALLAAETVEVARAIAAEHNLSFVTVH